MSAPLKFEFKKDTGPISLAGLGPNPTAQFDVAFGSTQGSVIYRSASAWTALTPGSSGQFLTTNGAAANPSWGTGTGVLPSQTSNSGKLLTTDGTNASWTTTGVLTSLTSPAATNLTLAGGSGNTSVILTPAGTGGVGIGTITPAQKLSVNGTMQWAQTDEAGYSGYLTNASTNAAYNPAITRNLIGSTGSTYTIAHGDMNAYAGIQFGISGTDTNAGNISFFAASGSFATNESVTPVARMFIANTGDVTISSSTAGSSGAGALVVTGGISAGAASYFGGLATVSKAGTTTLGNSAFLRLDDTTAGLNRTEIGFGYKGSTYQPVVAGYIATSGSGNTRGKFYIATRDSDADIAPTQRFEIAADGALTTTGAATFAGAVAIANTVSSVSPTSPNRTITMVVGGVTLYIAAKTTND